MPAFPRTHDLPQAITGLPSLVMSGTGALAGNLPMSPFLVESSAGKSVYEP
jgi:hypothetical protein